MTLTTDDFALEVAVDEEQGVAPDHATEAGPGIRPERDVDHAGLVLEREEDRALGRHRVLAGHDEAADPDRPRPSIGERRVGHRAEPVERAAEQRDDLALRASRPTTA